jgi:mono/diheme cytochrome c family protein
MKLPWLLILMPAAAFAQGEKVFQTTCATGYCHGAKGEPGGAPRLAARGFDQDYIRTTVTRGVPGTAMPAFGATLNARDLAAVVAYVAALNGIAGGADRAPTRVLSADASRGRELFSDATRSFGRCATCHEVEGIGIPVATPIANVPSSVTALRSLRTRRVMNMVVDGESFPGLLIGIEKQRMMFYDLTSLPPVERTLDRDRVKSTGTANWYHAGAFSSYNDAELSSILTYLQAALK